uniref:BPTI/Kunitz inhibitor domain-containing protein n=1 Tax=Gopherus agassizii TaxID=38772 RepID=A0A452HDX8_9SAUR
CPPLCSADLCHLPSVCGSCKARFPRFFYNWSSQACEEFVYGGCGGNKNNFETKEECLQACRTPAAGTDRCAGLTPIQGHQALLHQGRTRDLAASQLSYGTGKLDIGWCRA